MQQNFFIQRERQVRGTILQECGGAVSVPREPARREAVECVINGDLATGKAVLRDYVNATVGFQRLEKRTQIPAKSLMRMLGPKGSPSAANLSSILTALQKTEGIQFELSLRR